MKIRHVIHPRAMPVSLLRPFWYGALIWLLLDRFRPPAWVDGIVWTLFAIIAVAHLVAWWQQDAKPLQGFGDAP